MKNVYEFKIDDIKEVIAVLKNDEYNYKLIYERVYEKNTPTLYFREVHSAYPYEVRNKIYMMCKYCGNRTEVDKYKRYKKKFRFKCEHKECGNKEKIYHETMVKDFVLKLFTENFEQYNLYINGAHII